MGTQINTRNIILDILLEVNENGAYSDKVLGAALRKYQYLTHADRAFISRVAMGSVERRLTLDYVSDCFSKVPTAKMKPVIRNIIRMSIYQILYMDAVEDYAACSEAVKLAAKRGFGSLKGFVNGVLRNIARSKNNLPMPDASDIARYFSVKYSTPEWIVDKWLKQYGEKDTESILASQFDGRPLTVRCNTARTTPDALENSLKQHGIKVFRLPYLPEAMSIEGYDYLEKTAEFREGLFSVQDVSSMLVGHVAVSVADNARDYPNTGDAGNQPKDAPPMRVIDVCAAPGGKSLHMAELLGAEGYVEARDLTLAKISLIVDNIKRLGLDNIKAVEADATVRDKDSVGVADVVVADLPCSGLGIIGRKPDIKYNATPEGCASLAGLQRKILSTVSEYVKPGGLLVYSTCTLNPDENTGNARWFADNFDFDMVSMEQDLPESLRTDTAGQGYVELLPGVTAQDLDGFFIAKFRKRA